MKLTIEIRLDNDAFEGGENPEFELKRIIGGYLESWQPGLSRCVLLDSNGNTAGVAVVSD